ncbi:UNVERIFIED_CONTAM: hypothetical protein NCL1_33365 [Trichonephila clavipes]
MRSSTAHVANDKREKKLANGQLRSVISQGKETCISQNARLPSTEAFPADRRLYEGYGDRAEKGSLVVSSNRGADTNRDLSTVHRLWRRWLAQGNVARSRGPGAGKCGTFEGSRRSQADRRIRRQAVAAPQATPTSILQYVQDTLECSNIDQNRFPSIG